MAVPPTAEECPEAGRPIEGPARAAPFSEAGVSGHAVALEQETLGCMNELMQALTNSPSVESFLQLTLERLLEISRSRAAYILARSADRLHVRASRSPSNVRTPSVGHVVVLKLIEKCL